MDAKQQVENQDNKEDKKGILGKVQDITTDKDEQVALIGVAVSVAISLSIAFKRWKISRISRCLLFVWFAKNINATEITAPTKAASSS